MSEGYDVVVSNAAQADLTNIVDFLTIVRSPIDATGFVDAMLDHIATLSSFPHRGSIPREFEEAGETDFRQTLFGRYRIIYEVVARQVTIVLVADGRRDMAVLLRERVLAGDASH